MSLNKMRMLIVVFVFLSPVFFQCPVCSAETPAPHYRIGPNDVLSIFVWREDQLTRDVTVMADGRISFPLIGEVMAQGKTVGQLRNDIANALRKYIDTPEVTVIVAESRSRRIYTIGNVNTPGPYPLQADMTVLQALSAAGGFAEWADTKNILIIRRHGGKEIQLKFNYKQFVAGKKLEQNIVLEPDDTIVVP